MNQFKSLFAIVTLVVTIAAVVAPAPEAKAQGPGGVTNGMMVGTFTNIPGTIAAGGNSNAISSVIRLRGGEQNNGDGVGVALWPNFVGVASQNATSNIVLSCAFSPDLVTWSVPALTYTFPLNGTTPVIPYTNLAPKNAKYMKITGINAVNQLSNVTVNSIGFSYFSP